MQLIPTYKDKGKLLEIGSSYGNKLLYLKEIGWNGVLGVELNKKCSDHANKVNGVKTINKRIEELNFKKNSFDAIIMGMVLEHLYNPFANLKLITEMLKPKRELIFSIPYYRFEFKLYKSYAYGLHLPFHITFFNKKIIIEYLNKLGYKNIKFYFQHFDRDLVAPLSYLANDKKIPIFVKNIAMNKIFRFLFIKPFVFLLSLLHLTSRVTVVAIKK